jgi:hypothetical protein
MQPYLLTMTETYLHFIWKLKRLPFHQLTTTDGKPIHILNNGIHNISESGPDFFNARIAYEKMEWAGQIEIHVKSSDWYKHKHHTDKAYDNVILHVVYENDQIVTINGAVLPTIELKPFIDKEHYQQWGKFASAMKDIPCEDSIQSIDAIFLRAMIHRAVTDRLNRKINQLLYLYDNMDNQSVLYHFLARAFGTKINTVPFELLSNQLPLTALKRWHQLTQKRILLKTSGLFENEPPTNFLFPFEIQVIQPSLWKRKGLRPPAFPEKRVVQFAEFVSICDFELLAEYYSPKEAYHYIEMVTEQINKNAQHIISEQLLHQLFINAFLPYYWFKAIRDDNNQLQEFVLSVLEEIKSEDNYILKKWQKIGIQSKNAYESQALIELYNEYCSLKKCLNCQVGVKILRE